MMVLLQCYFLFFFRKRNKVPLPQIMQTNKREMLSWVSDKSDLETTMSPHSRLAPR
jgi:hypothetical protein